MRVRTHTQPSLTAKVIPELYSTPSGGIKGRQGICGHATFGLLVLQAGGQTVLSQGGVVTSQGSGGAREGSVSLWLPLEL